jgi:hypothetical protein
MNYNFRRCPFCGGDDTIKIIRAEDLCSCEEPHNADGGFFVICGKSRGGCGCSSGYGETEEDAVGIWNSRYRDV